MHAHRKRQEEREAFWSRVVEALFSGLAILLLMAILALTGCGVREAAPAQAAARPTAMPANEALRFLAQATVGPRTGTDVELVQRHGFAGWLEHQFAQPPDSYTGAIQRRLARSDASEPTAEMVYEAVWQHRANGSDRLRARTVFALSQLLPIEAVAGALPPAAFAAYMDMLNRHAFGNYRQLLREVLHHPDVRQCPERHRAPVSNGEDEARHCARLMLHEWMLGRVQLTGDGRAQRDARGNFLPAVDDAMVDALARTLRRRDALPERAVTAALDAVFLHPNLGPYVASRLIERFVTDTPSPAYVARVARTFEDNGAGVRGDLRAVIRAILLDAEARGEPMPEQVAVGR